MARSDNRGHDPIDGLGFPSSDRDDLEKSRDKNGKRDSKRMTKHNQKQNPVP
jgi:hypothetical protein